MILFYLLLDLLNFNMMISLKHKFAAVLVGVVLLTSSCIGLYLLSEKQQEIEGFITTNTLYLGEFAVEDIIDSYHTYYENGSQNFFHRDLAQLFSLNENLESVDIVDFKGKLLFRSKEGGENTVSKGYLSLIQDIKPGFLTNKRHVFIVKNEQGKRTFVDKNEVKIESLEKGEHIVFASFPSKDNTLRVVFQIHYKTLDESIVSAMKVIFALLAAVSLLSIIIAYVFASRVVAPIQNLTKAVQKMAQGDLSIQVKTRANDETKILSEAFNSMTRDLQSAIDLKIEHEIIEKELDIAGSIQDGLFPEKIPSISGLDIACRLESMSEVGGDCYDFLEVKKGHWLFYVGDATGHGIPASLVVAQTNAAIFGAALDTTDVKTLVDKTNRILQAKTKPNMFMTLVACLYKEDSNMISYVQAGHDTILHYSAKTQDIKELDTGAVALGMMADISKLTKLKEVKMEKDDVLVLYTDGSLESWNDKKEIYGMDRFMKSIQRASKQKNSAQKILDLIEQDIHDFRNGTSATDDMTLLVVKKN